MVGITGNDYIVFIIRIRPVAREIQGAEPVWYGEIEYLDAGMNITRRAFFKSLDEIIPFIQPVLTDLGLEPTGPPPGRGHWFHSFRAFVSGVFPTRKS